MAVMSVIVRPRSRCCLPSIAVLLTLLCGVPQTRGQFPQPPPPRPPSPLPGYGAAGVTGIPGAGAAGVSGIPGAGAFGGDRYEYRCSRCNTKVSATTTVCPGCQARLIGTTFEPGFGALGSSPGVLGGAPPTGALG